MDRRTFLMGAALAAKAAADKPLPITIAVEYNMLPAALSVPERMRMARDAGFTQVECPTTPEMKDAEAMKRAADDAGLRIHSVMNLDHWKFPFSSADAAVVRRGMQGARTSIGNARLWGADTVLLVPAVVDANTSYRDAYTRSQSAIRELIPEAKAKRIVLAVEEVWNKFLLSPVEFARYIDEFQSPTVRAYFDVGNVVLYGYPQDWIRVLGPRIAKLHIKDFSFRKRSAEWTPLLEGEIDWKAIYASLEAIGYKGTATCELPGGDLPYLQEVNSRMRRIFSGT